MELSQSLRTLPENTTKSGEDLRRCFVFDFQSLIDCRNSANAVDTIRVYCETIRCNVRALSMILHDTSCDFLHHSSQIMSGMNGLERNGETVEFDMLVFIKNLARNVVRRLSPFRRSLPPSSFDLLLFNFKFIREANLTRTRTLRGVERVEEIGVDVGEGWLDCCKITRGGSKGAVLYCNPNAGLWELQSPYPPGLPPLSHASQPPAKPSGWVAFYLDLGYDVICFNYRGYGWSVFRKKEWGSFALVERAWWFLKDWVGNGGLSPRSLCEDGKACVRGLVTPSTPLIIHGESIGGMVAASSALSISSSHSYVLVIVDRTFSSLEAVAQRMLGRWIAYAMKAFLVGWDSDVVKGYVGLAHGKSGWRKVLAQDPLDEIINYPASLLSGISTGLEMKLIDVQDGKDGGSPPKVKGQLGWIGVGESGEEVIWEERIRRGMANGGDESDWLEAEGDSTSWPSTKVLGCKVVVKFSAVMRGFGIRVTRMNRISDGIRKMGLKKLSLEAGISLSDEEEDDDDDDDYDAEEQKEEEDVNEGIELTELGEVVKPLAPGGRSSDGAEEAEAANELRCLNLVWKVLSLTDGLSGMSLGYATKLGRGSVCSWLSSALRVGPMVVSRRSLARGGESIVDGDFSPSLMLGGRMSKGGIALPEALSSILKVKGELAELCPNCKHMKEVNFICKILSYAIQRTKARGLEELQKRRGGGGGESEIGDVLPLKCGHNNGYTKEEASVLTSIVEEWEGCVRRVSESNPIAEC